MASQQADGEWTIYVCPACGYMDPDQYTREADRPRHCPFSYRGLRRGGVLLHPYSSDPDAVPVEFVPIRVREVER